jgi:hypothetical protein
VQSQCLWQALTGATKTSSTRPKAWILVSWTRLQVAHCVEGLKARDFTSKSVIYLL